MALRMPRAAHVLESLSLNISTAGSCVAASRASKLRACARAQLVWPTNTPLLERATTGGSPNTVHSPFGRSRRPFPLSNWNASAFPRDSDSQAGASDTASRPSQRICHTERRCVRMESIAAAESAGESVSGNASARMGRGSGALRGSRSGVRMVVSSVSPPSRKRMRSYSVRRVDESTGAKWSDMGLCSRIDHATSPVRPAGKNGVPGIEAPSSEAPASSSRMTDWSNGSVDVPNTCR